MDQDAELFRRHDGHGDSIWQWSHDDVNHFCHMTHLVRGKNSISFSEIKQNIDQSKAGFWFLTTALGFPFKLDLCMTDRKCGSRFFPFPHLQQTPGQFCKSDNAYDLHPEGESQVSITTTALNRSKKKVFKYFGNNVAWHCSGWDRLQCFTSAFSKSFKVIPKDGVCFCQSPLAKPADMSKSLTKKNGFKC